MNDQNLNNNLNENNNSTSLDNFNMNNQSSVNNATNVEVLDENIAPTNNFNSFVKPPEIKQQSTNDLLNSVPKPDMMISSPASNSVSTEDLLEEFVGKNYEKISKRKYNLAALFLTGTYLMYRKMYLIGILYTLGIIVLQLILSVINPILSIVVFLGGSLALCFMFNKFYLNNAKKTIEKIKNKNTNKSIQDLKSICSKKGGTNLIMTIILSIITSILVVVLMIIFSGFLVLMLGNSMLGSLIKAFDSAEVIIENNDMDNEEKVEEDSESENTAYNGIINYNTGIMINDKINMGYLQVFSPSTFNSDYTINYDYKTIENDENSKCSFKLSVVNGYESSNTLINEMASYHNSNESVSMLTTTKNNVWDTFKISEELETTYYSATVNNNLVYILEYNIKSGSNVVICEAFYNGIINSIEFK